MGGLCCLTKLSWAWGGRRGLHCLSTSHRHRRKRGRHHYPQFSTDQIKLAADLSWKKRLSRVGKSVLLITLCYSRVPSCCTAAVKAEGLPALIFNLLAPNDALEAPGLEGRWQGERSLWMGQTHHTLMTSLILFEVPQRLKISCSLIGVGMCFMKRNSLVQTAGFSVRCWLLKLNLRLHAWKSISVKLHIKNGNTVKKSFLKQSSKIWKYYFLLYRFLCN